MKLIFYIQICPLDARYLKQNVLKPKTDVVLGTRSYRKIAI